MNRHNRLKLNAQISGEAAEWFIEFRTGDIDAASRATFDTWVRSSQEHLRAYLEIAAIWNEGGSVDALRKLDLEGLIALARAQENVIPLEARSAEVPDVRQKRVTGAPERVRSVSTHRLAIAAAVAFVTLATATLGWLQFHAAPTYTTDVGEQRSIRLSDGSIVQLNSQARVRVNFTDAERAVELLEGQALFQVAKNQARPFIVSSDDTRVRAVGTQFDVHRKRRGTIVTVVEGKVTVLTVAANADYSIDEASGSKAGESAPQRDRSGQGASIHEPRAPIMLAAGEQLTVTTQAVPKPARVNVAAATAWTQRQIVLESASLTEVAEEFNRYSTRRLVVEDSASSELRLSGTFVTDPDFLIRYLRERHDITVRETDKEGGCAAG